MAQVLIREVESEVIDRLKERARRNHRSLEAELRHILVEAAGKSNAEFLAEILEIRKHFEGRRFPSDSTDLIREDRDR
ncbi:MAG: Arc family DNA-binding protein [Candidatus Omnitrophica bacterium]|nr:Arc family DNA-binding protein [Candidatus Omnitrophota bacterium]